MVFRYYQIGEFSDWGIDPDDDPHNPWTFAEKHNATRVTVLALTQDPRTPSQKDKELSYSGPLYFDIDNKDDLAGALQSAVDLCRKLMNYGVDKDDLEIHLSGLKGVHIYVDARVFAKDKDLSSPDLIEAYAKLALDMWVPSLDFQVYSKEKGRMVRPPNGKRAEDTYKVRVSLEELQGMTPEAYKLLVKEPRELEIFPPKPLVWAEALSQMFISVKADLEPKKKGKAKGQKELQAIPAYIVEGFTGGYPECINMLAEGKRKDLGKQTFNQLSIQVGCWTKYGTMDSEALDSLHSRIVDGYQGNSGDPLDSRKNRLLAMHHYVASKDNYTFSCAGVRAILDSRPNCEACKVHEAYKESQEALLSGISQSFLYEKAGAYFADKDTTILVAPFLLYRDMYMEDEEDNSRISSSSVVVKVQMTGQSHRITDFSEEAWLSTPNFKREIRGIEGAGFFGTDRDVVRLRMTLAKNDMINQSETSKIILAHKIGVSYRRTSGPENIRDPKHRGRFTYVEPGWSINTMGIQNSHKLVAIVDGAPRLATKNFLAELPPETNEAFAMLLQSNSNDTLCLTMPWFLGIHLKQHVYQMLEKFPLLSLYGNAGTGKNATAKVMMRLTGVEGEAAKWTLEAPNCTKLPFQTNLSNSATIPRVLNEVNAKSSDGRHYRMVLEVLKAAYDSQTISRGVIGGGDRNTRGANVSSVSWHITAPVVALSEEMITEPAVVHRTISVALTGEGQKIGKSSFVRLEPRAEALVHVGRVLVKAALETRLSTLLAAWDTLRLPDMVEESDMQERLKVNYRILLLLYDWFIPVLEKAGLSEENVEGLKKLREHFLGYIIEHLSLLEKESNITEADKVIKDIALMAHASINDDFTPTWGIKEGVHYRLVGDVMLLDTLTIYPKLTSYKGGSRQGGLNIYSEEAFIASVRSMPYFISYSPVSEKELPVAGRSVLCLDMVVMQARNLPMSLFGGQ